MIEIILLGLGCALLIVTIMMMIKVHCNNCGRKTMLLAEAVARDKYCIRCYPK